MGFHVCGPDEALIVYGAFRREPKIVVGGRIYVYPFVQKIDRLPLSLMTLTVTSNKVYTKEGVPIIVVGTAQVKFETQNRDILRLAFQNFLSKSKQEIQNVVQLTLEAHQRAIMGSMTVEEIYRDRTRFQNQVFEIAQKDMTQMGFSIVSYTLKSVNDDNGYMLALGMVRTAEVKREAAIGEANAKAEGGIKEALAEQSKILALLENETNILHSQLDYELKQLEFTKEVNTRQALTDTAYQIQAAKTKQRIREEEMQIEVVGKKKQIEVQRQEVARKEKELDSSVRKTALAEKYRMETEAEGERRRVLLEAEAKAEAIRSRGEAEAFAIREKAKAEAEQMMKKAQAWEEYKDAALVDMVLTTLPKIASEFTTPLSKSRVTFVGDDGEPVELADGELPRSGPTRITAEVVDIMGNLPLVVERLTGVNITTAIQTVLRDANSKYVN